MVVVLLDIETGVIYSYDKKNAGAPDLQIPISEVQDVQNLQELGNENKFFIQIRTLKESFKFYSKNLDVVLNWVEKIRDAVRFYQENSDQDLGRTYRLSRLVSVYNFEELDFEEDDEENGNVSFQSFEVIQEIGVGSFGTVFKVVKKDNGKRYAMKVLSKQELKRNNQLKYAVAECKILKKLNSPFIIPLFWAFQTPKNIYLVFEYCPHGDLSKHIPREGLSESKAKIFMSEVLLALDYLHSKDILYRDLKPSNVLIDETCHLKLTDFGLARENIHKTNLATTFCGSPAYLAPEVLSNKGFWKPADIYSFGACLFEVLSGRPLFEDDSNEKLFQSILNNKIVFPGNFSSQAKNLIQQLLNKNPEKRPNIQDIKNHGFFEGVKWAKVQLKQVDPAFWLEETNDDSEQVFLEDRDYSMTIDQRISKLY
jgi:serum/glucocorticoid-regulated kinase 2